MTHSRIEAQRAGKWNKVLWAGVFSSCLGGALLAFSPPARADVYACKDKDGVRFADRKLPGYRCTLYAKTPKSSPSVVESERPAGATGGGTGQSQVGTSRAEKRRLGQAFGINGARAAVAPVPEGSARFDGNEPEALSEREALYQPYIVEAAALYNLPEPFIRAVIRVESNFRYRAESSAGAKGLMQLMPVVLREMGVGNPWDPRANVLGGARLLRVLADRYDGDMVKVLAAYHAGAGAVAQAEGIPYEATESYVRAVLDRYYSYRSGD